MSALDNVIDQHEEYAMSDDAAARDELAALRATIAEQERKLEQARGALEDIILMTDEKAHDVVVIRNIYQRAKNALSELQEPQVNTSAKSSNAQ